MRQVLRIYAIDIYLYGVIAAGHVHTWQFLAHTLTDDL